MTCKCITCSDCDGSGSVWYSCTGEYLGNNRGDDLDELELCDYCEGTGIVEVCDECQEVWLEEMREQERGQGYV